MSTPRTSKPSTIPESSPPGQANIRITIFHCFNALSGAPVFENGGCEIQSIKMPCSSMTRELFLLRAFEAGARAVVVLVCPEGTCRYLEGNLRARKRVARVKKLLDEIGIGGHRLNLFNIPHGDQSAVDTIIMQTISDLATLGPLPGT